MNRVNKIKSTNIYYMSTFLDIISVVYALRYGGQNYLFFSLVVYLKNKKIKLVFQLFIKTCLY